MLSDEPSHPVKYLLHIKPKGPNKRLLFAEKIMELINLANAQLKVCEPSHKNIRQDCS